ncbi:MAG TPA: LysR substrate-binding domain-containing protein [Amycolatopsis sp.]|nr:LysR substrate-binding domain-containing protein [Amycolatopsis sp.]
MWGERVPEVPLELMPVPAAEAAALVRDGGAEAVLLRLPGDRDGLHAIPLYAETTVVVVPKDHLIAAADEASPADLAEDVVLHPLDDPLEWENPPGRPAIERPATTGDAIQLVAAGVGLLVVPQSLARLHHRRDLTYRPLSDVPQSQVALSWPEAETTDLMEQFIGIVRGRTVNSSRGRPQPAPAKRTRREPEARKPVPGNNRRRTGKPGKPGRRS